jgi:type IV secretion system protein VirB11
MTSAADAVRYYLDRLGLRQLLDLEGVEDVAVQEPGVAWVRRGKWERFELPNLDLVSLENFAIVAGSMRQQEHGAHQPILDTELPDGERLHVNAFPTVPLGTVAEVIRKHEDAVAAPETIPSRYVTGGWNKYIERAGKDLSRLTSVYDSGDVVRFICECVGARQNIILAGHTGSSKTTLLKTVVSAIDHSRRIITVQDANEIKILQPNHVHLLFNRNDSPQPPWLHSSGSKATIGPETLLQSAMRMHPDIIILGEMRGSEAWTYVRDVVPSHPGTVCTIHADSPRTAFMRMIGLCKGTQAGASYDDRTLAQLVADTVDVIVPLEEIDHQFHWHPVWWRGDAQRNGKSLVDLLS